MRTCKEVSMLLSQAQERPLGYVERFGVMLHLLVCKGCTNFRAQLDFLRKAMRRYRDADDAR
ncbi:MAG TPA: anti-sigma factor [Burkholderiales bacterium]|jgi:hypothetical protein|nr:anti-sigma factor [Burkholderiales bacterium]